MRIADDNAHRRMSITVLAAGRLKSDDELLYIRRTETDWTGPVPASINDLFRRDAADGTWRHIVATRAMVSFLLDNPVGSMGRVSGRFVEVIDPAEVETDDVITIEPPEGGWDWMRKRLTPTEQANIRYNFGLAADAPLPYRSSVA